MTTADIVSQALIALFGVGALFMQYSESSALRRYAPLVGLAGQPAWIYVAYTEAKWGMLVVTMLYTVGWLKGTLRNIRVTETNL